jgi:hypothetical protein
MAEDKRFRKPLRNRRSGANGRGRRNDPNHHANGLNGDEGAPLQSQALKPNGVPSRERHYPDRDDTSNAPETILAYNAVQDMLNRVLGLYGTVRTTRDKTDPRLVTVKLHWPGLTLTVYGETSEQEAEIDPRCRIELKKKEVRLRITRLTGKVRAPKEWYPGAQQAHADSWVQSLRVRTGTKDMDVENSGFSFIWTTPPLNMKEAGSLEFSIAGEALRYMKNLAQCTCD